MGRTDEFDHVDRTGEPTEFDLAVGECTDPFGESFELHRRYEHLDALGEVTQACGHVDRRADVVVAFEEEGMTGGEAGADRERGAHVGGLLLEVEHELDGVALVDRDDHAAVTEPLRDAHPSFRRHLADDPPEGAEDAAGCVVAERCGVVRESGQVDEHERAGDTHEDR